MCCKLGYRTRRHRQCHKLQVSKGVHGFEWRDSKLIYSSGELDLFFVLLFCSYSVSFVQNSAPLAMLVISSLPI